MLQNSSEFYKRLYGGYMVNFTQFDSKLGYGVNT